MAEPSEPPDPYNICHNCYLHNKDCCKTPFEITVGILEAINIHLKTGLKYSDFIEYKRMPEEQFQEAFKDLIPNGKAFLMKRRLDRACVFHTETGCKIFDIRPAICRVFPFWYDQDIYNRTGILDYFLEDRDCGLIYEIQKCTSLEEKCRYIGFSEREMHALFDKIFENFKLLNSLGSLFDVLSIDEAFIEAEKRIGLIHQVII